MQWFIVNGDAKRLLELDTGPLPVDNVVNKFL